MSAVRANHRGGGRPGGGPPDVFRMDGRHVRLVPNQDGTLTLTFGRRVLKEVRIRLGRPLYRPEEFATVLDGKGAEVGLIVNLGALPNGSRRVLVQHHANNNLTTPILKVHSLSHQFGAAFWDVETEKGPRQFVIRGTTEHVRWLDDERLLITDVQGNRFEIPDLAKMDRRSQDLIHLIL